MIRGDLGLVVIELCPSHLLVLTRLDLVDEPIHVAEYVLDAQIIRKSDLLCRERDHVARIDPSAVSTISRMRTVVRSCNDPKSLGRGLVRMDTGPNLTQARSLPEFLRRLVKTRIPRIVVV
jgi:hypothetical protein